jgi:hypothetical protein
MQNWKAATGHKTLSIRNDRIKEFMGQELEGWYQGRGIEIQPTSVYPSQENDAAERLSRSLRETTLAMLANSGLPQK